MRFDLLIKGGRVIDTESGFNGRMDVAVKSGRIATVDKNIPPGSAHKIIEAADRIVTPGLIDLHSHIYKGVTFWGIDADSLGSRTGVTTWIDAGSAGAYTLSGFRDFVVKPSKVRIYSMLNISAIGLVPSNYELTRLEWCDVDLFKQITNMNRDLVLGLKVRMGIPMAGELGIQPLKRARLASDICGFPMMVHIAWSPPPLKDVIALMKPGDILTHCFTGLSMRIVDEHGSLHDFVKRAWDSGVVMDIGHGTGSFSYKTAEAILESGYLPDVISTDSHLMSVNGPMFDLPTCMSKFLHLGMSLPQVIRAVTYCPAKVLGLDKELGTLRPGAIADISLFKISRGRFLLYDTLMNVREAKELLVNTMTIINGLPLEPLAPETPPPWSKLTEAQRSYHASVRQKYSQTPVDSLNKPEHFMPPVPVDRKMSPLPHEGQDSSTVSSNGERT